MTDTQYTLPHQLVMNDRRQLQISGVTDVGSFDEHTVVAHTSQGELTVRGHDLTISRLSVESGDLTVTGTVDALEYLTVEPRRAGLFGRLFK